MAENIEDGEDKENRLLRTLRRHLAEDNPNPKNDDCPSHEELRSAVLNPAKADPQLHRHLTTCSGCYLAFEGMLKQVTSNARKDRADAS